MYIKEIKDMINLMNDNGLSELEVEKDGLRIKLRKGAAGAGIEKTVEFVPAPAAAQGAAAQPAPKTTEKAESKNVVEIKSPMVGTFYKAPSPEAAPYVNIGDTIEPGQVICIIEAMKLMNEIKSEVKGKIVDIQAENAEPIEFGQVLFVVEPA
ncbi:MAG: acetyl-CoA carboxylase biotin carboxyl carrier protein [Candidatus Omnitrophica bacterium]|nr:acetyl-CoA carboxylase biotin carboxyl carrier protein [Candidatus Omnitrophota bacterium]